MRRSDTSGLRALAAGPLPPSTELEIIELDTPAAVEITFATSELLGRCPVTSQRDHYDAEISIRSTATLESKSLKLYLGTWDQQEILAEDPANTITDDIERAFGQRADSVETRLRQNVRGGLEITVVATRPSA